MRRILDSHRVPGTCRSFSIGMKLYLLARYFD